MSETPVTVDHYATLGVSPKAEDVVIRAAYLALMRRYHPDKDGSPESSERAQAIIAAFAVLGDISHASNMIGRGAGRRKPWLARPSGACRKRTGR